MGGAIPQVVLRNTRKLEEQEPEQGSKHCVPIVSAVLPRFEFPG